MKQIKISSYHYDIQSKYIHPVMVYTLIQWMKGEGEDVLHSLTKLISVIFFSLYV
jgi:hypothetical protein